jgi:CBS domain-containing protein
MDVASFLRRHPPFDALDDDRLARVVSAVEIEHFPPGAVVLLQAGAPATHLYVVRKGEVEIVDDGRVIDQVGEGEVFGMWSLLGHVAPSATVRATEDTLCYLVPAEVAEDVLETGAGVAFVAASVRRRISAIERSTTAEVDPGRYRPVGSLVRRPPVTCEPDMAISAAAELMARERVSSLLVPSAETGTTGILTDRDLRTRVVAERRGGDTPVREVMTPRVETVPIDAMAGEVLLRMLERGFHHFPVADPSGRIVGVVTDTDLMGIGRDTPFALMSAIDRAPGPDAVAEALRGLPRVVAALVDASADPVDVGHVVGFSIDAATRRLLKLTTAELGEAPAAWAWLALGSAARQEQALRTDQDHAIAFEGDAAAAPFLARLADAVTSGLEAGGIPRCRADAMATNAAMRLPLDAWVRRFEAWMREPSPTGSEQLSIVFDYRRAAGALDAEPVLDDAMRVAVDRPLFLRHLYRRALDEKPPTGFVRDLVVEKGEHAGTVDVKHGGIVIVTNLARAHAVGSGVTAKRTIDRLRGAETAGAIDAETREGLEEAFRFLWEVRLRHHVQRIRAGLEPDDFVDPHELGSVARQGLKEAFRIVLRAQRALALEAGLSTR